MRALVYTAPNHVEIRTLPEPQPTADEVLIQVAACGICGSDVHGFEGRSRIRVPPMVMGHEFGGRVVTAPEGSDLEPGIRVVVQPLVGCGRCALCLNGKPNICPDRQLIGGHRQGAFAEYVKAPARAVYPVHDALSDTGATLVEPLGNAVHMLNLAGGALDRNVVVLGAGTLGLLTAALARAAGARTVISTDVDEHRLEVARRLGADECWNARHPDLVDRIRERTGGVGADIIIDAAGFTVTRQQGVAIAAQGGTVVLLGLTDPTSEIPILDVINREIALLGSYSCTDADFRTAISILESGRIDTESWVHTASLDEGQGQFQGLASHSNDLIKVVFSLA